MKIRISSMIKGLFIGILLYYLLNSCNLYEGLSEEDKELCNKSISGCVGNKKCLDKSKTPAVCETETREQCEKYNDPNRVICPCDLPDPPKGPNNIGKDGHSDDKSDTPGVSGTPGGPINPSVPRTPGEPINPARSEPEPESELDQPGSTIHIINNTSEDPLHIFVGFPDYLKKETGAPTDIWTVNDKSSGASGIKLGTPVYYGPPESSQMPREDTNDAGNGWWQVLKLDKGIEVYLNIPEFDRMEAWRITPMKKNKDGKFCKDGAIINPGNEHCGMPLLIESGKKMVGNMSAVDGVNFKLKQTMTTDRFVSREGSVFEDRVATIDMKTNPCGAPDRGGCINPQKKLCDGVPSGRDCATSYTPPSESGKSAEEVCNECNSKLFKEGKYPDSDPCYHGTCNLIGSLKKYCDKIHTGQCSDSRSNWEPAVQSGIPYDKDLHGPFPGLDPKCYPEGQFTTYCYDFDDANSSPVFKEPYKMRLEYSDL